MGDEEIMFKIDPTPGLRRVNQTGEIQKRALISRDQMKSDQPCLLIPDCTIVIEENNEAESDRYESSVKKQGARQVEYFGKHFKLNEEDPTTTTSGQLNTYTEDNST